MRKMISLVIAACMLATVLAGCQRPCLNSEQPTNATTIPVASTTRHNDLDTRYIEWQYDAVSYGSYEQLVEESDRVFLGTVKTISFYMLDFETGKIIEPDSDHPVELGNLCTVYEISVNTNFKGDEIDTVYLALWGGIKNYREDEQRALLASFGLPDQITLHSTNPPCIIGEEYLFTLRAMVGWNSYLQGTTDCQAALRGDSGNERYSPLYDKILLYFNVPL